MMVLSPDIRAAAAIACPLAGAQSKTRPPPWHAMLHPGDAVPKNGSMALAAGRVPTPARPDAGLALRRIRRHRTRAPRLQDWLGYVVLRAAAALLGLLPLWLAMRVAEALAWLAWLFDRPHRRIGMINLGIAFPEKSLAERRRILRASFLNLGRMAAELAHLPHFDDARLRAMVQFEDEQWWAEAVGWERPTGVLILSGHFGNWELLVHAHGRRGHPVVMVHRAIRNPLLDRWLHALRSLAGTRLLRKSQAGLDVLRALREKRLIVLPFDQNSTRGLGVFVPFFGVAASTNSGIARIALRAGAPIVPAFIVRQGASARHIVHVGPVLRVEPSGDFAEDVRRTTERCSQLFEEMVRRHPEQWLWVHKRWKTRPAGEPRLYP